MNKPEKYLVLSERSIISLYNQMIEEKIQSGNGSVIVKCEMAGSKYPGQLQFTNEWRTMNYRYWPSEDIEEDDYTEIDNKIEIIFEALEYVRGGQ
jgi:hypothetical protein